MTHIKICGILTYENALMCAHAGADMLGFNFYKPSPRYIDPPTAQRICDQLRAELGDACPLLIGVFVNATVGDVSIITNHVGLHGTQLSGDESVNMLTELRGIAYKGIRPPDKTSALEDVAYYQPATPVDERLPSLLLDAYHPNLYGGTGETTSTEVAHAVKSLTPRLMLAGGLTPANVADRIRQIQPWGVDVASGVESDTPGIKDAAKVTHFITNLRSAGQGVW